MGIVHVLSALITLLDTVIPSNSATAGEGGPAHLKRTDGFLTVPASASADTTLRFVRVPSSCKVKRVELQSQAQTAGKVNVGVYYPILGLSGKADLVANAIDADFFASDVDLATAVQPTNITNESGTYTADLQVQPLWQALGIATDPGGYLDIVATVHTTDVTTGTGIAGISVEYTN